MKLSEPTARAIAEWKRAIGASNVITTSSAISDVETATFRTEQRVLAVLKPANSSEIQACMRIASRRGVPIHPIGRGKNWGYGSRVPYRNGSAILDLGRLNHIVDFDERLAYITVEPGVTFQQVDEFLRKKNSNLYMSVPGTTVQASPLANALERGIGKGILGDRFLHSCAMEVVLSSGDRIRTGFARFPHARTSKLHRSGVGPSLDGLFSQSTLGIVTQLTLWLTPLPAHADRIVFILRPDRSLDAIVDELQQLHLHGVLRGPTKLFNDYRLLSGQTQYPWAVTRENVPLRRTTLDALIDKKERHAWIGVHTVEYFHERDRTSHRLLLKAALADKCDALRFEALESSRLREHFAPANVDIQSTYWRKRGPAPADPDPDRDRCGVIFTAPLVPFVGKDVTRAVKIIEKNLLDGSFEPMIAITMLEPRVAYLVAPLFYDRVVPNEDAKAHAAATRTLRALTQHGYLPYRTGLQSDSSALGESSDDVVIYDLLQRALDPAGILGRRDPAEGKKPKSSRQPRSRGISRKISD